MPLQKCTSGGKDGWRWGDAGRCYTGADAKEKAIAQGVAIGDLSRDEADEMLAASLDAERGEAVPVGEGCFRSRWLGAAAPGFVRLEAAADDDDGTSGAYVESRWRFFSAGYYADRAVDVPEKVVRKATKMWGPQKDPYGKPKLLTVFTDHDRSARNWVGQVTGAEYVEAAGDIPAGVEGVIRLDREADSRVARGVERGVLRATSVGLDYEWEKSHPKMGDDEFWSRMGQEAEDGERICRRLTKIVDVYEQSIVWDGADAHARRLDAARVTRGQAGLPPAPVQEEIMDLSRIGAALGLPEAKDVDACVAGAGELKASRDSLTAEKADLVAQVAVLTQERDGLKAEAERSKTEAATLGERVERLGSELQALVQAQEAERFEGSVKALIAEYEAKARISPATRETDTELVRKMGLEFARKHLDARPELFRTAAVGGSSEPGEPPKDLSPMGQINALALREMATSNSTYSVALGKVTSSEAGRKLLAESKRRPD